VFITNDQLTDETHFGTCDTIAGAFEVTAAPELAECGPDEYSAPSWCDLDYLPEGRLWPELELRVHPSKRKFRAWLAPDLDQGSPPIEVGDRITGTLSHQVSGYEFSPMTEQQVIERIRSVAGVVSVMSQITAPGPRS
jgi:hypothetical protein